MEKHLLNYLKKPEQLNDVQFIIGKPDGRDLYKQTYVFITKIIPNRVIKDKVAYMITHIDKRYHLDGFAITTENDRVMYITVYGFHPNCKPETDIFCLPDFKKGVELTDAYLDLITTNLQTYYLDNCYFNPTGQKLKYKKMNSIYVQLNR